jgi:thiol-disulfide isomerase/thioredoxin
MKEHDMTVRILPWLCIPLSVFSLSLCAGELNKPAPACNVTPLAGGQAYDLQQFKGKVVYVDFWASWCTSCAKSFPFLNNLDQTYKSKGLAIIGINLDDDVNAANDFLTKYPPQFSVAADASKQCATNFSVEAMPSTYLIDKKGVIRYVHQGFRAGETQKVEQKLEQLLLEN